MAKATLSDWDSRTLNPKRRKPRKKPLGKRKKIVYKDRIQYVPVDIVWSRKWAKTRWEATVEDLLLEVRDNISFAYIVKIKWLNEPKKGKYKPYTIYNAELDVSGDYFILSRSKSGEGSTTKPKLVIPQYELARLLQLQVIEVYVKRKTTRDYKIEKGEYEDEWDD